MGCKVGNVWVHPRVWLGASAYNKFHISHDRHCIGMGELHHAVSQLRQWGSGGCVGVHTAATCARRRKATWPPPPGQQCSKARKVGEALYAPALRRMVTQDEPTVRTHVGRCAHHGLTHTVLSSCHTYWNSLKTKFRTTARPIPAATNSPRAYSL
jgi:hypothetical protein